MSRGKAWLLTICAAALAAWLAFFAGRLTASEHLNSIRVAESSLEQVSLSKDYAPDYCLSGATGFRDYLTQTAFVIQYPSDRAAMLREIAHTVGWHMAQVTAQDYRLFAHAALWTEAEVLQAWDDVCFDAWFYHETTPPWNPPELPAGPLSEIGELGRGFRMALFDAESGLFVYVNQFG